MAQERPQLDRLEGGRTPAGHAPPSRDGKGTRVQADGILCTLHPYGTDRSTHLARFRPPADSHGTGGRSRHTRRLPPADRPPRGRHLHAGDRNRRGKNTGGCIPPRHRARTVTTGGKRRKAPCGGLLGQGRKDTGAPHLLRPVCRARLLGDGSKGIPPTGCRQPVVWLYHHQPDRPCPEQLSGEHADNQVGRQHPHRRPGDIPHQSHRPPAGALRLELPRSTPPHRVCRRDGGRRHRVPKSEGQSVATPLCLSRILQE